MSNLVASRRIRVALFVNSLGIGGSERNVSVVARRLDRARFHASVWTILPGGPHAEALAAKGIPVHCLNRKSAYSLKFAVTAAWQISRLRVDVIHVFLPAIGFYVALARRLFGMKTPVIFSEGAAEQESDTRIPWLKHLVVFSSDLVTANSSAANEYLVKFGVDKRDILTVFNGHDPSIYEIDPDRSALRASLGLGMNVKVAVLVGRLVASKRVEDALQAVALLRARGMELRLVIVGDGPHENYLRALTASLGLGDAVVFAGQRRDVPSVLRCSDVFVFPSESEGLPNALIEACLAGLPCVAASIPGVLDVVRSETDALLVPPRNPEAIAESLAAILTDSALRARLGKSAREKAVQTFAIDGVAKRWMSIYEHQAARKGLRHPRPLQSGNGVWEATCRSVCGNS